MLSPVAPIATSVKDHIGATYGSGSALADAVADGEFNVEDPLRLLSQRIGRALQKAYHGAVAYKWSQDTKYARIEWVR